MAIKSSNLLLMLVKWDVTHWTLTSGINMIWPTTASELGIQSNDHCIHIISAPDRPSFEIGAPFGTSTLLHHIGRHYQKWNNNTAYTYTPRGEAVNTQKTKTGYGFDKTDHYFRTVSVPSSPWWVWSEQKPYSRVTTGPHCGKFVAVDPHTTIARKRVM